MLSTAEVWKMALEDKSVLKCIKLFKQIFDPFMQTDLSRSLVLLSCPDIRTFVENRPDTAQTFVIWPGFLWFSACSERHWAVCQKANIAPNVQKGDNHKNLNFCLDFARILLKKSPDCAWIFIKMSPDEVLVTLNLERSCRILKILWNLALFHWS